MASTVKVAVLGTGSLGKEHVRLYAELAASGLVAGEGLAGVLVAGACLLGESLSSARFARFS